MRWKIIIAVGIFGGATIAAADMYECNGVWTNAPCGAPAKTVAEPETKSPAPASALEVKASDILKEPDQKTPDQNVPEPAATPAEQKVPREKRLMVSELRTMNKACRSYYSLGQLRRFERECLDESVSVSACHEDWSRLHAEMLGEVRDEKCRNAVFSATNKYEAL